MPTSGRPEFARESLIQFGRQTYERRELVILDDSNAPSFPNGIAGQGIRYYRQPGGSIGAKRNRCCELAEGELICHWDDDDFSAPGRIEDQVSRIIASTRPVTGYNAMEFRELESGDRWLYSGAGDVYALGTSLMYRKWYWERNRFLEVNRMPDGTLIPEDVNFLIHAQKVIACVPAGNLMWASIHPGNMSPRQTNGALWSKL